MEHWLQIGNTYYNAQEYSQALLAWQKALEIQPDNIDLYRKIGKLYSNQAKYHDALNIYGKLLKRQPEAWDIWLKVAKIQLQLLDITNAEKSYLKCRNKITDSRKIFIFAGDLQAVKGNLAGAERNYRQALLMNEKNQSALARLAICLLGQHQERKAENIYQKLIGQKPSSTEILMQISHYWQLKNNDELAAAYIKKAIEQDTANIHLQTRMADFYLETK